jgi:hypothetical protein
MREVLVDDGFLSANVIITFASQLVFLFYHIGIRRLPLVWLLLPINCNKLSSQTNERACGSVSPTINKLGETKREKP